MRRQAGPGPQAARVTGGRRSRRRCGGRSLGGRSLVWSAAEAGQGRATAGERRKRRKRRKRWKRRKRRKRRAYKGREGVVSARVYVDFASSNTVAFSQSHARPTVYEVHVRRGACLRRARRRTPPPHDLCVNVLVRPTRISPRQSGAAGPCSTLRGCTARPGSSVTYCSQQRRPGRVPRFIGAYHHRQYYYTVPLCLGVSSEGPMHRGIV